MTYLLTLTLPDLSTSTSSDSEHTFRGSDFPTPSGSYTITCKVTDDVEKTYTTPAKTILVTGEKDTTGTDLTSVVVASQKGNLVLYIGFGTFLLMIFAVGMYFLLKKKK